MKKGYYQISAPINDHCYIHVNFMDNNIIILKEDLHNLFVNTEDVNEIKDKNEDLYTLLVDNDFLIPDSFDELSFIELNKKRQKYDSSLYQIVVNPTLDCNLSCWYCYEKRKKGSSINENVIEAIKKNIILQDDNYPFKTLKLSFFGGEPFLRFNVIKDLAEFASNYCEKREKSFILDFTTNGSIIKENYICDISQYPCMFQITLDGNRNQHNKIKFSKNEKFDAYKATINNIKLILDNIENCFVAIRINFDAETLLTFDDILDDIKKFDRKRVKVILKKIWQVSEKEIDKQILLNTMQKLFNNNFVVDYYTQGGLCFGDLLHEAVINYDGKLFKCTTIDDFNEENSFGNLDLDTGDMVWKKDKIVEVGYDLTKDKCKKCRMYPSCYGPCTRHLLNNNFSCFLDSLNLSIPEYLMFLYKNNAVRNYIYGLN